MEGKMKYDILELPNGLRLVCACYPQSSVEYFGIAVKAGSADENDNQHGLAHFVEHTIFKGTTNHSSTYIINCVEKFGGELNAFTNKEETVVYSILPAGNIRHSMAIIADIVTDSIFPDIEIEKERMVIADEIDSYLDSPSEAIFDEFDENLFKGYPLAHNILGTKESLTSFNPEICRHWLDTKFCPSNSVLFYSGPLKAEKIGNLVLKAFSDFINKKTIPTPSSYSVATNIKTHRFNIVKDTGFYHQCHVAIGFGIPGYNSEYQHDIVLLSNMLGGPAMNSILNMNMREKRGLVYSIDSYTTFYKNTGSFIIYFGCDSIDEKKCRKIITKELERISESKIKDRQLEAAKRQYKGQLEIVMENREQAIMNAARALLLRNRILSPDQICRRIENITPESLYEAAQFIYPELQSSLILK